MMGFRIRRRMTSFYILSGEVIFLSSITLASSSDVIDVWLIYGEGGL